jgi:GTP-binding protein
MGKKMHGKNGEDLIISVPAGTIIKSAGSAEIIADLHKTDMEIIVAKGGRGGLGNAHFATPVRQAPRYAQPGEQGEEKDLVLELKLLADVGLVGLPNAGKSTLLSVLSAAKPKIADYPFTTLRPVLGVVKLENFRSFVVADIPGLIEGAHRGAGLGSQFLRHVERTSILLHMVDISDMEPGDPAEALEKINREIELYSKELKNKPMAVVGTKLDIAGNRIRLEKLKQYCTMKSLDFLPVSSVLGTGLKELLHYVSKKLEHIRGTSKT